MSNCNREAIQFEAPLCTGTPSVGVCVCVEGPFFSGEHSFILPASLSLSCWVCHLEAKEQKTEVEGSSPRHLDIFKVPLAGEGGPGLFCVCLYVSCLPVASVEPPPTVLLGNNAQQWLPCLTG